MEPKKLINSLRVIALASVFAVSAGSGLAYANINIDSTNELTGPGSENIADFDIDDELEFEVSNEADVDNDFDFEVNTGANDFECNTCIEDITTGDIEVAVDFNNELNTEGFDLNLGDFGGDIDISAENYMTGPGSDNYNLFEIDTDLDVDIENEVDIDNDVDLNLNTGYNDISHNTSVGSVTTGDIEVDVNIENIANQNTPNFNLGNVFGDIDADFSNDTTGCESENVNEVDIDRDVDIDIENNADIDNRFDIDANTGDNKIGCNTVVGDITTGNVRINITGVNQAN